MKKLLMILSVLIVLIIPVISWTFKKEIPMNIVILDKTVPDQSYREHKGLTWLLNHKKIINPNTNNPYDVRSDYYGFFPFDHEKYDIHPFPDNLENVNLIYIADTYGVYEADFYHDRATQSSELIYGGLTLEEINTIRNAIYKDRTTLVAEFNTFASPTSKKAREEITDLLALDWSGWIGRYFRELDLGKTEEITQTIVNQYERQENVEWNFSGSGFVLIHEDESIVVLEEGTHVGKGGIHLRFTDAGQNFFDLKESPPYYYWFDIVDPHNQDDVLAYYNWDLTTEGKEKLDQSQIPLSFAAITKSTKHKNPTYYFAGDFVDIENTPTFYQYSWLPNLKKFFSINIPGETKTFYWKTYVPMMRAILKEAYENSQVIETNDKYSIFEDETGYYSSRIDNDSFQLYKDGEWKDFTVKGVNMGMAKPGTWPGEAAITEQEYYRWFEMIGEMNANTIRVYTLHPPGFYRALERYNRIHDNPIYLFQGAWIEEESLEDTLDAFTPNNVEPFKEEISHVIDAVHGNTFLEEKLGHASGHYNADISPYVLGWILGIEWYPQMVFHTNERHKGLGEYDGDFVYTKGATAFEYWLADMFEHTLSYEQKHYNWQRPISFTNWVTTDLLEHPSEPSLEEDLVGVDPNVIHLKENIKSGQFASYHVYPYYPDFMNYEQRYLEFIDHRSERNNYAAYLRDLHSAHEIPILIAEFGVPSSRGLTHKNPFGWNQGFLSEKEQGEINAILFEDIIHEGLLGGLVFAWQDEWFKRTWNTMELDNKDRRPYWSNAQTNEQRFGLLSFDQLKITLSGTKNEWSNEPLYEKDTSQISDQEGLLKALYVEHDEQFLYLRIDFEKINDLDPFENMNALLLIETIPDQGITDIPFNTGVTHEDGVDFLVHLSGVETSRVLVDRYYDPFYFQYGHQLGMIPELPNADQKNNGIFNPIQLTLNKELIIPSTNETIPFEAYETGKLKHGIANPNHPNYDSLADFYIDSYKGMIELRLPWLLLNVKDPSLKEIIGNFWEADSLKSSEYIEGIKFSVLTIKPDENGLATPLVNASTNVLDSFPEITSAGAIQSQSTNMYTWENWEQPISQERLKQSYYIIQELFEQYK